MKVLNGICNGMVGILFAVLMTVVYIATLFLDRNIANPFPNYAPWSSGGYYAVALLILVLILKAAPQLSEKLAGSKVLLFAGLAVMAAFVAVYQYKLSRWMPVHMVSDFQVIREVAINLAEGGSFQDRLHYFQIYPNNVGIAVLLSWIYRLVGNWRDVIFAGLLVSNLAAVLTGLIVYNSTKNTLLTLLTAFLGEILIAMNWRAAIPYTDNFAMLFVALILLIYTSGLRKEIKAPLLLVAAMIGTWIKITVLIVFLAVLIDCVLRMMIRRDLLPAGKKGWISLICTLLICAAIAGVCLFADRKISQKYQYERNGSYEVGWQYYFMMGQDESGLGTVMGPKYREAEKEIDDKYSTKEERMAAFLERGMKWFKEKGIWGNIFYFMEKIDVSYNDGQFNAIQNFEEENLKQTRFYKLYIWNAQYNHILAGFMQVIWYLVLIMIGLTIFNKRKDIHPDCTVMKIVILGMTLYILLFEDRSKYLYMFLPAFLALAGLSVWDYLKKRQKDAAAVNDEAEGFSAGEKKESPLQSVDSAV